MKNGRLCFNISKFILLKKELHTNVNLLKCLQRKTCLGVVFLLKETEAIQHKIKSKRAHFYLL